MARGNTEARRPGGYIRPAVFEPGKLPGAAVTVNADVAAATFVMEQNATARDVRNTAEQIVGEILRYEDQIKTEAASRR